MEDSNTESNLGSTPIDLSVSTSIHTDADGHDLRDSGISITDSSHLNNFNHTCYEDFELRTHQQEMNINSSPKESSPKLENPPPIPPKVAISVINNTEVGGGGSLDRKPKKDSFLDVTSPGNYSVPKLKTENGEGTKNIENTF